MKVIGAGFGRTGTTSLKAALEELGFGPSYHMTEVFVHPEHVGFWEAARRGERVNWERFFEDYGVAVDWPACSFYEELMETFPEAPVILSVRDPERWYESVSGTIYQVRKVSSGPVPIRAAFAFAGLFVPGIIGIARLADEIVWDGTFGGRFEDKPHAIETFERHNEEVRRRVPPERLLVYEVKQGWGPLCDFLGLEAPDKPFPRLNDAREMRRRLFGLVALSAALPVLSISAVAAAMAFFLRRAKKSRR